MVTKGNEGDNIDIQLDALMLLIESRKILT